MVKKKKRKKEEVQTMKIVKKDNKDELCMQEYEDLCYTPIRVDTIDMGQFMIVRCNVFTYNLVEVAKIL